MKLLFERPGITAEIRQPFVMSLAGYDGPMNELLAPRLQDIERMYADQFMEMNRVEVSLDDVLEVQCTLPKVLTSTLDERRKVSYP